MLRQIVLLVFVVCLVIIALSAYLPMIEETFKVESSLPVTGVSKTQSWLLLALGAVVSSQNTLVAPVIKMVLSAPNMVLILANVLFFMLCQLLFWKHFGSKQFNVLLEDKTTIYSLFNLMHRPEQFKRMLDFKREERDQEAQHKSDMREQVNDALQSEMFSEYALYLFVLLALNVVRMFIANDGGDGWFNGKHNRATGTFWLMLLFTIGAFSTEVAYFFLIVRQYEFYGDHKIYRELFERVLQI